MESYFSAARKADTKVSCSIAHLACCRIHSPFVVTVTRTTWCKRIPAGGCITVGLGASTKIIMKIFALCKYINIYVCCHSSQCCNHCNCDLWFTFQYLSPLILIIIKAASRYIMNTHIRIFSINGTKLTEVRGWTFRTTFL